MRLKPKTIRRLLLLSFVLIMFVATGVAMMVLRNSRNEARLETRRAVGLEAAAAGNHFKVVEQLGGYLRRRPHDPDVLLAYARARRNVEDRNGNHLPEAALAYQQYLGFREDDQVARRELLRCYAEAGLEVEVTDVARRLRPADPAELTPDHLEVLRYEIPARQSRRDFGEETFALARRAVQLAPGDFGFRIQLVALLRAAQRPTEAADFIAESVLAFPNDPRVELLRLAAGEPGEATVEESLRTLASIAGLDPDTAARTGPPLDPSETVLAMLVNGFDALGRPDLTLSTLESRARDGDLVYVRAFARRALYTGHYARLVQVHSSLATQPGWTATDVLALVALALDALEKRADAEAMFDRIAKSPPDYRGLSWTAARPHLLHPGDSAPLESMKVLRAAIAENPLEPIFRARLCELLLQLGRAEEARAELAIAGKSPLSDGWARLGVLEARSFLFESRLVEARRVCLETVHRFPADPVANATLLAVRGEMLDRGYTDSGDAKAVVEHLGPTLDLLSGPEAAQIAPEIRATLMTAIAVAADKASDEPLARRALALAAESDAPFSAPSLSRLVEISGRRGFDLESALLQRAERAGTTPASTLVRAILLHSKAQRQEAADLVRREASAGGRGAETQWRVLLPCFLDVVQSPDALQEWKTVIERFPDDTGAHLLALQSRSVSHDHELVNRVADRLDELSGSRGEKSPLLIRLARARALALRTDPGRNRDQLIGLLRAIVNEAPDLLEPRLLLADALLGTPGGAGTGAPPHITEAVEHLRAAIPFAPDPAPIRLRIAGALHAGGNDEAARAELAAVVANEDADPASRWAGVDGLAALGQFEQAAALASTLAPSADAVPTRRAVSLARLLILAGRSDDAHRVYTGLSQRDDLDAGQVFEIAEALTTLDNASAARAMLDRLAADPARSRNIRRVRARLDAAAGSHAEAQATLRSLTASDPADVESWRLLVESLIASGDLSEARRVLDAARAGREPDPGLELLVLQLDFRAGQDSIPSLAGLADALDRNPEFRERAKAVRAYAALREKAGPVDSRALRELAAQFQDEPTLQAVIISDLLNASPPALAAAAEISLRAARRFPAQWQTSADVVRVHRLTGQWNIVLEAAERWRRLNRTRESDFALGEAHLRLNHVRQARAVVEPYVEKALQQPDESADALVLWGAVLIADGQAEEASRLLNPLMERSARVLEQVWLPLAADIVAIDAAPLWLEAADTHAASHGSGARLALAMAWSTLAGRDQARRVEHLARSRSILEQLATAKEADPRVLLALGEVAGEMNDLDAALAAFTSAAEESETRGAALRGIAQVHLTRGQDADAAVAAARKAVEASDSRDPGSLRILGDALLAAADVAAERTAVDLAKQAAAAYDAALDLVGESPALLDRLARACEKAQEPDKVIGVYERVLALPATDLTSRDRAATQNNLAFTILSHRKDPASLQRARDLAQSASSVLPVGAVFDTLGSIESLLGNRSAAIDALHRSLNDRPDAPVTLSKLAELLAAGSSSEREEASRIVRRAEKAAEDPQSGVTSDTRDRLRRVRTTLGMP